jgi:hypothetical protein
MGPPAERLEIPDRVVAPEHHVAAAAAVTAVRAALGHVRLTAEAERPVAAGTGLNVDPSAILHTMMLTCPTPSS